MNTYPTLTTESGSDPTRLTKLSIDRAEDGTARVRSFASDKSALKLTHPWLSSADKATLDAFYAANRLLVFICISLADGVTRNCVFVGAPQYRREVGNFRTATVEMEQV